MTAMSRKKFCSVFSSPSHVPPSSSGLPTLGRWERRLPGLVAGVIGSSGLLACGSVQDGYSESYCQNDGTPRLADDLNPDQSVDHVGLYTAYEQPDADGDERALTEPALVQGEGEPCATGSADCEATLATAQYSEMSRSAGLGSTQYDYLASTQGDEVTFYLTLDEVRAFLGTIDTPSEATLLAHLAGYDLDCNEAGPNLESTNEGYVLYAETGTGCGEGADLIGYRLHITEDGEIEELGSAVIQPGDPNCAIGRIPAGLRKSEGMRFCGEEDASLGAYFARVSQLEAASVAAFEVLAIELAAHGAPDSLLERVQRAAREEKRHALLTGALARHFGHPGTEKPVVERRPVRGLEAIATENAVEGLVREAFGALVASYGANHARDPAVRSVLSLIAGDETRHAALSFDLHEWVLPRLSAAARQRVQTAHAAAYASQWLLCQEQPEKLAAQAGLPSAQQAEQLYGALGQWLGELGRSASSVGLDSGPSS